MSEPIWCNVRIATPKSWGDDEKKIPGVDLIYGGLINGNTMISDDQPDRLIWAICGEGNYGLSDEDVRQGLDWLADHRVPYYASSEPKYDMTGEIEVFDGKVTHEREGDNDGSPSLCSVKWAALKKQPDPIAAVDAFFTLPDIDTVNISHLPEQIPEGEE